MMAETNGFQGATAGELLESLFKNKSYSASAKVWLMLMTGEPTKKRGASVAEFEAVEVSSSSVKGYKRVEVQGQLGSVTAATQTVAAFVENNAEITAFTSTGTGEVEIKAFALCTSETSSSNKILAWGTLTGVKIGELYTPAKIASGKLKIELG